MDVEGRFDVVVNVLISVWSWKELSSFGCNWKPCTICGYDIDVIKPFVTAKCLNYQNEWNFFVLFETSHEIWNPWKWNGYLYCWSIWAFSMRLSLARRFWNQILICVSVNCKRSANSKRRPREIYSLRWNSTSKRIVCSLLNVVLCRLGRPSFRLRRATMWINKQCKNLN